MYRNATRASRLDDLSPAVRAALTKHAAQHQLVLGNDLRVWITRSENPPATGFFGKLFGQRANSVDPDVEHDTVVVLHGTHLVMVTSGEKRGTTALSVPLALGSIQRGSAIAAKLGIENGAEGVTISGLPGEHGNTGSYFVSLGPEPAATECAQAIEAAIVAAKNR